MDLGTSRARVAGRFLRRPLMSRTLARGRFRVQAAAQVGRGVEVFPGATPRLCPAALCVLHRRHQHTARAHPPARLPAAVHVGPRDEPADARGAVAHGGV